jgi:hypothetical protein
MSESCETFSARFRTATEEIIVHTRTLVRMVVAFEETETHRTDMFSFLHIQQLRIERYTLDGRLKGYREVGYLYFLFFAMRMRKALTPNPSPDGRGVRTPARRSPQQADEGG